MWSTTYGCLSLLKIDISHHLKVIFNPGAFISVIKCACADTFQSVFPQCADWCVKSTIDT
jgi:hypothetical protein